MAVQPLHPDDVAAYTQHVRLHMRENGDHGLVFAPIESGSGFDDPSALQLRMRMWKEALRRPPERTDWMRAWVIRDPAVPQRDHDRLPDGGIVGHVDLRGGSLPSELHRCKLGIGVYAPFRGKGLGAELLDTALEWARDQRDLAWVDLSVFSHNLGARKLYDKREFAVVGETTDRFRVHGASVDDVQMTLKLR